MPLSPLPNFIFSSGHVDAIPRDNTDRRWTVVEAKALGPNEWKATRLTRPEPFDINQVKADFENGVSICRATLGKVIDLALAASMREFVERPTKGAPIYEFAVADIVKPLCVDALDFEPDENHTIADMANCGRSLMEAIKEHRPHYCWNNSPSEIVGDLINELNEVTKAFQRSPA
jgi:hypothetical protein